MYLLGAGQSPDYGTALVQRVAGLGCAGGSDCGCGCGGSGLGLFESSDWKLWGGLEWGAIALGVFALFSMLSTTRRGVSTVRGGIQKRSRAKKRRREIDAEISELRTERRRN